MLMGKMWELGRSSKCPEPGPVCWIRLLHPAATGERNNPRPAWVLPLAKTPRCRLSTGVSRGSTASPRKTCLACERLGRGATRYLPDSSLGLGKRGQSHLLERRLARQQRSFHLPRRSFSFHLPARGGPDPRLGSDLPSWSLAPRSPHTHQVRCRVDARLLTSLGISVYGNGAANQRDVVACVKLALSYSRGKHNSQVV